MKVYQFCYHGTIASYPKPIPAYHILDCADNVQGEFVTLESHRGEAAHNQQLIRTQAETIRAQEGEIEQLKQEAITLAQYLRNSEREIVKLRDLLQRWGDIGREFDIYPTIKQLKVDTTEALK